MEIKVIRCDVCKERYMLSGDDEEDVSFTIMQAAEPVQAGIGNGYALQVCSTCISYMPWKGKTYGVTPERLATDKAISFELDSLENEDKKEEEEKVEA